MYSSEMVVDAGWISVAVMSSFAAEEVRGRWVDAEVRRSRALG